MLHCDNPRQWMDLIQSTCTLPEGFSLHTTALEFFPVEKPSAKAYPMRLSLIKAHKPTEAFGAVFTRNAFPGAPVLVGRERLGRKTAQAILVNNKISNVGSPTGKQDSLSLCEEAGKVLGINGDDIFPSSTGIIGWSLPVAAMKAALPKLASPESKTGIDGFAQAIMTTDSYPKAFSVKVGEGSILGFAKGAGMIEPNMATMLVFILTDLALGRAELQTILARVVDQTFNCISVDSDQSTSDSCFIMSSGLKPAVPAAQFEAALKDVCAHLASHVVRNGEGTAHVMRVKVSGFGSFKLNRDVAKAVVNSPLVKTAVYGNDPNIGRIIASMGDFLGNQGLSLDASRLRILLGDTEVFGGGAFRIRQGLEEELSAYFKSAWQDPNVTGFPHQDKTVDITVILDQDKAEAPDQCAVVYGSDLGYEYVKENADYRS